MIKALLAGKLMPKAWTNMEGNARPSSDMKAHVLLTLYHVTPKRRALDGEA